RHAHLASRLVAEHRARPDRLDRAEDRRVLLPVHEERGGRRRRRPRARQGRLPRALDGAHRPHLRLGLGRGPRDDVAAGGHRDDHTGHRPRRGGPADPRLNQDDPNNTPDGDGYVFLVDNYSAGGYRAFVTTGDEIAASRQDHRLSQQDGWEPRTDGLPESPRHGAFVSAPQQVLDAMHGWQEVAAVPPTTELSVASGTATATVTAQDGGDVAGTVEFSAPGWSETAQLADGEASVAVPEGAGMITASYRGYRDGLVAPSRSEPTDPGGPARVAVSTATRCVAGEVTLMATASNLSEEPATIGVTSPFGRKPETTLQPGGSHTAAFSTRASEIAGGEVDVDTGGDEVSASYAATSCE